MYQVEINSEWMGHRVVVQEAQGLGYLPVKVSVRMSAKDRQVGGNHYEGKVQPIELILNHDLDFCAGSVVKYVVRYRRKGTPLEDLEKAKHYLEFLIEKVKSEQGS